MASERTILYFGPGRDAPSDLVIGFAKKNGFELRSVDRAEDVHALLNRSCSWPRA
jgi:hypothetical protein